MKTAHRKAVLRSLAIGLLTSPKKRIFTTVAKAKALRTFVEPIITKSKENTTHSRRMAFSSLQNKDAIKELFGDIAAKVGDRPGGYTRILKIGARPGDNAEMALIELVDFNEFITEKPKKKTSRRRKKTATGKSEAPAADKKTATPDAKAPAKEVAPVVEEVAAPVEEAPVAEVEESAAVEEAGEETASNEE